MKGKRVGKTCKPGSVSHRFSTATTALVEGRDGDHLSSPPQTVLQKVLQKAYGSAQPGRAVRRCRRGQAANPGTSRTPMVPLFGLAPGGVWPSLCHHRRPDALTVRFQPYPRLFGSQLFRMSEAVLNLIPVRRRYVSVPLSVPCGSRETGAEAWALPSTLSGGARTFLPGEVAPRRGGHPVLPGLSIGTLAYAHRGVKKGRNGEMRRGARLCAPRKPKY